MITKIIDGKALSQTILSRLKNVIEEKGLRPSLLIIQVGDNPASNQYVALKKKRGEEIGISIHVEKLPTDDYEKAISLIINQYQSKVQGIMIQLPLPDSAKTKEVLNLIPPKLDVDGLRLPTSYFKPAVVDAVLQLLSSVDLDLMKQQMLVIGDSPYVGHAIKTALEQKFGNEVLSVDEFTKNPVEVLQKADIVISCVGKPHGYAVRQMKAGATLIDVGTSKNSDGKIVGDFDITEVAGHLLAYTPVPGGVGPMTIASLLQHTVMSLLGQYQQ